MAQAVLLPKLGQTVEEASIVKWHKQEGDSVQKGEVLFEIETDKAVLEAESFYSGTLLKILVGEGETVPVSSVVGYVGEPGESVPDSPPAAPAAEPKAEPESKPAEKPEPQKESEAKPQPAAAAEPAAPTPVPQPAPAAAPPKPPVTAPAPVPERRLFISPRARALARVKPVVDTPMPRSTGPESTSPQPVTPTGYSRTPP